MAYKMFLDDERFPSWVGLENSDYYIVRSVDEFIMTIKNRGWPSFITFDHDLGEKNGKPLPTGFDAVKWLVEYDLDTDTMPDDFRFNVHSANPVGRENIESYLNSYIKQKD